MNELDVNAGSKPGFLSNPFRLSKHGSFDPSLLRASTAAVARPGGAPMTTSAEEIYTIAAKSGWLFKRGGGKKSSAWKRRWFVLSGQTLLYYKTNKDKKPKGSIAPLRDYLVQNDGDDAAARQYLIRLVPRNSVKRVYYIYASSQDEKEDWMELMQSVTEGGNKTKKVVQIEEKLRRGSYMIEPQDLTWNEADIVGKGASGIVKKGLWLNTTEVAVKALNNVPEFTDEEEMVDFYTEIETLSQLRHPNIVSMFGYCKKQSYLILVTEFMRGGDLAAILHNPSVKLDINLKMEICSSICRGMVFLHAKNVIHRDLKPQNILVENLADARIKVCDFGLSTITNTTRKAKGGDEQKTVCGTPAYAAPELSNPHHNNKVDVFSFGVIIWEIITRKQPWEDSGFTHAYQILKTIQGGDRLPLPKEDIANTLIEQAWATEPTVRPDFRQIYALIERLKSTLDPISTPSSQEFSPAPGRLMSEDFSNSIPIAPTNSVVDRLLAGFQNQASISWEEFVGVVRSVYFYASPSVIEKLRFSLGNSTRVEKQLFATFMDWFRPLGIIEVYETEATAQQPLGYEIEEIARIVGPSWFFGFMTASEAKDVLLQRGPGSYLFRFSSNAGCYALSINYGQVGHWRINTEKISKDETVYRIDGKPYSSLQQIVNKHELGGEPLVIKGPNPEYCFLKEPADRNRLNQDKAVYENMYQEL